MSLKSDIKNWVIVLNFKKLDIQDDAFMTMIGPNKNGAMIKYTFKLAIKVIKNSFKFERSNHILSKTAEKIKLPTYGYVAYTNSIYLKIYIDLILLILFSIAVWIILLYETHSRAQMETTYATITNLKAQTQTTSVLLSIETNYAILQSQVETWYYRFTWMKWLDFYSLSCLIQDLAIIFNSLMRGFRRLISPSIVFIFITNIVHYTLYCMIYNVLTDKFDDIEVN